MEVLPEKNLASDVNSNSSDTQATNHPTWTILVYIHADHNLDANSVQIFDELKLVAADTDNFQILVQWDRRENNGIKRGRLKSHGFCVENLDTHNLKIEKDVFGEYIHLPEENSDNPKILQDFISWGIANYSAMNYGMILWDHGGQWLGGFGGDFSSFSSGMRVEDLIESIQKSINNKKFRFIGIDACLMGGLELLVLLKDLAEIYIANPESEYGSSWDYKNTLQFLKTNPNCSMTVFGGKENFFWQEKHKEDIISHYYQAHSIYNLETINDLIKLFRDFSNALIKNINEDSLKFARSKVISYGKLIKHLCNPQTRNNPDFTFVDIGNLAQIIYNKTNSEEMKYYCKKLVDFIRHSLIIDKTLGELNSDALGLSIWMPIHSQNISNDEFRRYNKMFCFLHWDKFLIKWRKIGQINQLTISDIHLTSSFSDPKSTFIFSIDGDHILSISSKICSVETGMPYANGQVNMDGKFYSLLWDKKTVLIQQNLNPFSYSTISFQDKLYFFCAEYQESQQKPPISILGLLNPVLTNLKIEKILDLTGLSPRNIAIIQGSSLTFQNSEKIFISEEGLSGIKLSEVDAPTNQYVLEVFALDWMGNIVSSSKQFSLSNQSNLS